MTVTFSNLPDSCATRNLADDLPIMIMQGQSGYVPLPSDFDIDGYNTRRNVTPAQIEAMIIGSMFGWQVPGANPSRYDDTGRPHRIH